MHMGVTYWNPGAGISVASDEVMQWSNDTVASDAGMMQGCSDQWYSDWCSDAVTSDAVIPGIIVDQWTEEN